VIVGNNELWDVDYTHNHVWVKPNTTLKEGGVTTISYIGESNKSYELLLKRSKGNHSVCYMITASKNMINKDAWSRSGNSNEALQQANTLALKRQKKVTKQIVVQTQDALKKYRKNIFTGYSVVEGEGWYSNNGNLIDSVYDDGRFTYIRVTDDSRGLMSVYGEVDGKQELLEFDYDAPTMVYQVSGVFPKFKMRAGDSELVIKRD
jgi:type IV secretory pathway VirB9-like protein